MDCLPERGGGMNLPIFYAAGTVLAFLAIGGIGTLSVLTVLAIRKEREQRRIAFVKERARLPKPASDLHWNSDIDPRDRCNWS